MLDGMDRSSLSVLTSQLALGDLLEAVRRIAGGYELIAHWKQGEFHHDVVLRARDAARLPGPVIVVATNCNGGVKEVLCFDDVPDREALWHSRCPDNTDFRAAPLPALRARETTIHWLDPCELLLESARSELRPEHRERQKGGGWTMCSAPRRAD